MKIWAACLVAAIVAGNGLMLKADEPAKKSEPAKVETKLVVGQKAPDFKILE